MPCMLLCIILSFLFAVAGCGQPAGPVAVPEESVPTMPRGQTVLFHNGDIYFQWDQDPHNIFLYKRASDGANVRAARLPDDGYMQIVDGRMYFATHQGELNEIDLYDCRLTPINFSLMNSARDFVFTPEWLYGQHYALREGEWVGEIYRIRYDGSGRESLSSDAGLGLQSDGGHLYYFSYTDDAIVKMGMDGADKEILVGELRKKAFSNPLDENRDWLLNFGIKYAMAMYDGWIYYIDDFQMYRVRTDGTGLASLNAEAQGFFAVGGASVVFLDKYPGEDVLDLYDYSELTRFSISAMDLDGRNKRVVSEGLAGWPTIAGGHVYFWAPDEALYRFPLNGSGLEQVFNYQAYQD